MPFVVTEGDLFSALCGHCDACVCLAVRTKTVCVAMVHGDSMDISAVLSTCHGVVDAFYPGIHGAAAIADTIFGDHNPGGKLPFTMCEAVFAALISFLCSPPPLFFAPSPNRPLCSTLFPQSLLARDTLCPRFTFAPAIWRAASRGREHARLVV